MQQWSKTDENLMVEDPKVQNNWEEAIIINLLQK
jgi:hypothetical protein